jgi:hypothetical protein
VYSEKLNHSSTLAAIAVSVDCSGSNSSSSISNCSRVRLTITFWVHEQLFGSCTCLYLKLIGALVRGLAIVPRNTVETTIHKG